MSAMFIHSTILAFLFLGPSADRLGEAVGGQPPPTVGDSACADTETTGASGTLRFEIPEDPLAMRCILT